MTFTQVTVVGSWSLPGRGPLQGEVELAPTAVMRNAGEVAPGGVVAPLVDGAISVTLTATNDAGTTPSSVLYRVIERIPLLPQPPSSSYYISVPAGAGTIDLRTVTRLQSVPVAERATREDVATAVAASGGGGGAVASVNGRVGVVTVGPSDTDLPEASPIALTAPVTASNLLGKTTRYDTTAAPISQTLPAAVAGAVLAIGWDAGANTFTYTAAGSDVIGPGSVTSATFTFVGELRALHCTTAGRWRETSKVIPGSALALSSANTDLTGAAVGRVLAASTVSGGVATGFALIDVASLAALTALTARVTALEAGGGGGTPSVYDTSDLAAFARVAGCGRARAIASSTGTRTNAQLGLITVLG